MKYHKDLGKQIVSLWAILLLALAFPNLALAQQADGPHRAFKERRAATRAEQDKQIDAKLATLEQRFGKKLNVIYILTDDIGWGELGWQGGGKHRGTPSPALAPDKLAFEGMRFWSACAEPSCTPPRIAIMTGRHPMISIYTVRSLHGYLETTACRS